MRLSILALAGLSSATPLAQAPAAPLAPPVPAAPAAPAVPAAPSAPAAPVGVAVSPGIAPPSVPTPPSVPSPPPAIVAALAPPPSPPLPPAPVVGISGLPAAPATAPSTAFYPIIQILPIPGYNNSTDGFNALGSVYTNGASSLTTSLSSLEATTIQLNGTGGLQFQYEIKANISYYLASIQTYLWDVAYDTEKKVCAIVTSINRQNVDNVKGNLRAGIYAEAEVLVKLAVTLTNLIAAIKAHADLFIEAEKAVVTVLIQAIVKAATASIEPATRLSQGLTSVAVTGINDVVQSASTAVVSLQGLAKIDWSVE